MYSIIETSKSQKCLLYDGHRYLHDRTRNTKTYWRCERYSVCPGRVIQGGENEFLVSSSHNHNPDTDFDSRFPHNRIAPQIEDRRNESLGYRELSSDSLDYDMDAWKKANPNAEMKPGQHYPDTYKLPNHMTFSDDSIYSGQNGNEGGHWGKEDNKWTFTPGKTNLQYHTIGEMKDYFKKVEPDSKLIINK